MKMASVCGCEKLAKGQQILRRARKLKPTIFRELELRCTALTNAQTKQKLVIGRRASVSGSLK